MSLDHRDLGQSAFKYNIGYSTKLSETRGGFGREFEENMRLYEKYREVIETRLRMCELEIVSNNPVLYGNSGTDNFVPE